MPGLRAEGNGTAYGFEVRTVNGAGDGEVARAAAPPARARRRTRR